MSRDKLTRDSSSLQTSAEIVRGIAELVGKDRDAIVREWEDLSDADAVISRAVELQLGSGEPLFWDAAGRVARGEG